MTINRPSTPMFTFTTQTHEYIMIKSNVIVTAQDTENYYFQTNQPHTIDFGNRDMFVMYLMASCFMSWPGTHCTYDFSITWWRHQMETFSALLALCEGIPSVTGGFPSQRQVMFALICAWTNSWANYQDAGDLRRHRAHYDVTVMRVQIFNLSSSLLQSDWYRILQMTRELCCSGMCKIVLQLDAQGYDYKTWNFPRIWIVITK